MSDDDGDSNKSRRRFLALAGVSAVGFAGCSSDDGSGPSTDEPTGSTPGDTDRPPGTDTDDPSTETPDGTESTAGTDEPTPDELIEQSHGVAVGDATDRSAVFWSRLDEFGVVHVEYAADEAYESSTHRETVVDRDADNTARIRLEGLESGTRYRYRAWGTPGSGGAARNAPVGSDRLEEGTFTTAPASDESSEITLAWSGDAYGYGRKPVEPPFEALGSLADLGPDAFLFLGDTMYADAKTPAGIIEDDPSRDEALEIFRNKYREMRNPDESVAERTNLRKALASTSVYATWDDHEVENDFDRTHPLLHAGRDAFLEYWPVDDHESVTGSANGRMFRKFRWGERAEVFVLDTRQYKSPVDADPDSKTMLSRTQIEWLEESLRSSDADVKIVASTVTFGIHSGDGWSAGGDQDFQRERDEIVDFVSEEGIENVVVLSADIHKAQVVTYGLDSDSDVEIVEASAGPLGAHGGGPNGYDSALDPTPHFERGNEFFNFGVVHLGEDADEFEIRIHAEGGTAAFSKTFPIS